MIEPISLIVLVLSLTGLMVMALKKMPVLVQLPETMAFQPLIDWQAVISRARGKISLKKISLSLENFLHKLLSKIRVLTLKTESKTSSWLQKLRERAKMRNRFDENDNYWKNIRETTKKK